MKRSFAAATAFAVIASSGVIAGPGSVSADGVALPDAFVSELSAAGLQLVQVSMLEELGGTVPGFGTSTGLLLGLHEAFAQLAALDATSVNDADDLIDALAVPNPGGFEFSAPSVSESGGVIQIDFDISLPDGNRTVPAPLAIMTDDVQVMGANIDIDVSMPTAASIRFEYDPSLGSSADAFAITQLPTFTFDIDLNAVVDEDIVYGFAEATASGNAIIDTSASVTLVDPDGTGRLTGTELQTLDIVDAVSLDLAPSGGGDVDIDLELEADVFGTLFTGTLTVDDESIFGGDEAAINVSSTGLNPIDLMTNLGSESSITGLAQLVSGFGVAMIGGDVEIPFLSNGVFLPGDLAESGDFDRVFEVIQPILDYVEPRSAGQIVCGTMSIRPVPGDLSVDGTPFGQTKFLTAEDTVECRAYTTTPGTDVTWTVTSGNGAIIAEVPASDGTDTIGDAPTQNIRIDMSAAGELAIEVRYTPTGGVPTTIVQRPDSIQELLLELLDAGLIPEESPSVPAFEWEAGIESITFDLSTTVAGPIMRSVEVNAGNSLVAQTGITGLSEPDAGVGASARVDISGIDAAVTLGLILTENVADINPDDNGADEYAPGPGDRFFVRGADALLTVEDVDLFGAVDMVGRLGFLDITAELAASLTTPAGESALTVGLGTPVGVTIDGVGSDANATLIRDVLRNGPAGVTFDANVVFEGTLLVEAAVPGISASGTATINWDLDDPKPTVNLETDFQNNLFPFDTSEELVFDGTTSPTDETLFISTTPGLLAQAGLVGSQLVDDDNNTCTVISVLSDTTLQCENASNGGMDLNPISFTDGDTYEVTGNTLAYLTEILAAIEGLAGYLEEAVGDAAFDDPLPVIGVTPRDLIGQISALRSMVDEFRGVQDGQIICTITDPTYDPLTDPAGDVRAIATDTGGATLSCNAVASASAPSDIRWRINVGGTPGSWIDGPDTVGSSPASSVSLSMAAADANGDGYIAIGDEYTVEAEWVDNGDVQSAVNPPRTPQSLGALERAVREILDLPEGVLELALVDAPANPTLRINLGYGICSDIAPDNLVDECANAAKGPTPTANLNFDLGGSLPALVGLSTTGEIGLRYAALGQFDIGVPLDGESPLLYGTTGLTATIQAVGDELGVEASVGPVKATLGNGAGLLEGTAAAGTTAAQIFDDAVDLSKVPDGALVERTSGSESCLASGATTDAVDCTLATEEWAEDDEYRIGDQDQFLAALEFTVEVLGDGGLPIDDDVSIALDSDDLGIGVSDFSKVTAGAANCGPIDTAYVDENVIFGVADGDNDLSGLACARLSMELQVGEASVYLGELALDWDGGDLTVYVPADLVDTLSTALLDPAFLLQALPGVLRSLEGGLRSAADSGIPAAVGDPLHVGADGIGLLAEGVELATETFGDALIGIATVVDTGGADDLVGTVTTQLEGLLESDEVDVTVVISTECSDDGAGTSCDDRPVTALRDISALVTFSGEYVAGTGVNLGLEGLPISFEAGIEGYATWSATVGIGVNFDDGPYLQLNDNDDPEVEFEAGVRFNSDGADDCTAELATSVADGAYTDTRCLRGRLAFLFIEALDNTADPSAISATASLDITGTDVAGRATLGDIASGALGAEFEVVGEANLDVHIRTGIGSGADLPTILGTFQLEWAKSTNPANDVPLAISFDNLHLDLGSFLSEFLGPIAREVKKVTAPLQPIIDVLMAPIPVVSDLAVLVGSDPITMISLLEIASGADLSLVRAVAAYITFFNTIPTTGNFQIGLGDITGGTTPEGFPNRDGGGFNVDVGAAASTVSAKSAGALIGSTTSSGSGFASDISSGTSLSSATTAENRPATFGVPGLSFPFLEDASQIFGLLVGRDATLIRWDAGTLEASAGFSWDFGPIMVGPVPITITIGGEVGVRGRFAIGYDTSGIRQLLDGGSGVALFDGIFIDDLDTNGNDVPEVEFFGRVFAGASVDLVIVSAGVRGGIELTFSLDLDDRPDPDGKLRISEIVDKIQNPICLFTVSGRIEAFLEAFVKIDLFFFSKEFSFELVRITLLEWSSACEPPEPELSRLVDDPAGNVLYLNVGSRANLRNIQEEQIDESVEIRQIGPRKVRVTGYGWEETRDGVDLIVADAGSGSDELLFLNGTKEGSTGLDDANNDDLQLWSIPVVASGGPGNDVIKIEGDIDANTSDDHLFGDGEITEGSWQGISYDAIVPQGAGPDDADNKDNINAGPGDDLVEAGPGNDVVDGQAGRDTVLGGDGNDDLDGGPGDDVIDGQVGEDTVQGGPIERPLPGEDADDDDVLIGGPDSDVGSGDFGNDIVFGDGVGAGATAALSGPNPNGRLQRNGAATIVDFQTWCDAPGAATDGNDILTGTDGNDVLVGGAGIDSIEGGNGDDWACGGPGDDVVRGNADNDVLRGDGDNDVLEGAGGNDRINGGDGIDFATGGEGNDDIFGDGGSDLLFGDSGNDVIVGDTGSVDPLHDDGVATDGNIDPVKVESLDMDLTVNSSSSGPGRASCDIADALGASDCLYGGAGSDALFGGSDGDFLFGQSGADLLEGNDGDDDLRGGTDNDLLLGSADSDLIYGDSGNDEAVGDRSIAQWLTNTPATGAADTMFGGPGADHLEGDGGDDQIAGGAANDHIEGNNGADTIRGEGGNDDLIGGSDTPSGTGDSGDDGDLLVLGGLGQDVIAGDNAVISPVGYVLDRSVTLLDLAVGGADTIEGDGQTDAIFGQVGNDIIYGDDGLNGPFEGGGAADYLEGDNGQDSIFGEAGGDDIVGGGSAGVGAIGAIVANRDGTGLADAGETTLVGGPGRDWIAGDNARLDRVLGNGFDYPNSDVTPIKLFDLGTDVAAAAPGSFGNDTITGGADTDLIFGQGGNDILSGDGEADYIEGNDGDDSIDGADGADDLIGGGSSTIGLITLDRTGTGLRDGGESLITGVEGRDWIAGDNARMNRVLGGGVDYPDPAVDPIVLFDLERTEQGTGVQIVPSPLTYGADIVFGGDNTDLVFGQGGNDTLVGDGSADYIEGNDGNDAVIGGDGDDDLIGGGSAWDGVIDLVRDGEGLHDEGETVIEGNDGIDWIMGDNAVSNRVLFADVVTPITLFDVNSTDQDTSGGDVITGGPDADLIFGQGNGFQGVQSDPVDGIDNDGDQLIDEDGKDGVVWLGDIINGDGADDYIEGNHGADLIFGDAGNDDIAGGGSAIDGIIAADRVGTGLADARDTIWGGLGDDVIGGDNVRILAAASGPLWLTDARDVTLFDVNSGDQTTSGGDFIGGEDGADVLFGQGNGFQDPAQADPFDGFDNDLDGREGDGAEYDCFDGADNDGDGAADNGDGCTGKIDEDQPWDGDIIWAGPGVDYVEGNHGGDWISGGTEQDDLIGGGSALDGHIVAGRSGVGLHDESDVINGDESHDVIAGDNATINKVNAGGAWALIANGGGGFDLLDRTVTMATAPEAAGNFDADHLLGNDGHDQLYGQQGDDLIEGNAGDDGVIGDLGTFITSVEDGSRASHIKPKQPFIEDDVFAFGTLTHLTELFAQETGGGAEGNDIILGGQGHDDLHGGPGNDIMNGDRYDDPPDPELVELVPGEFVWDDPALGALPFADEDALFGGWGDDVMWGGRDPDQLYGGHGMDYLDVRPRPDNPITGQDPPSWFTWVRVYDSVAGEYTQEHYQDSDMLYGGWNQDVMQSNLAKPGPNDGDRLFDWAGAHNLYYVCAPHYGDWTATRALAPGLADFLNDLAAGDGLLNPSVPGSSGFSELGLVYNKDVKSNANPPHPETPGHFYCGEGL